MVKLISTTTSIQLMRELHFDQHKTLSQLKTKTKSRLLIDQLDPIYQKKRISNASYGEISYNILPPKIMQIIDENASSPLIMAIYREADSWKIVPLKQFENQPIESYNPQSKRIGIPTFEGYEFVSSEEIIRCEGLQKCSRIHFLGKPSLVSSYNIGEFEKLLKPYGFFSTHKSHLINLSCIRKYSRDGCLYMSDNSVVPVARRRKSAFLEQFAHI